MRRLGTPTIGIGVIEKLVRPDHAALAQQIDDIDVSVEDIFAVRFGKLASSVKRPDHRPAITPASPFLCLTGNHPRRGQARCAQRRCQCP